MHSFPSAIFAFFLIQTCAWSHVVCQNSDSADLDSCVTLRTCSCLSVRIARKRLRWLKNELRTRFRLLCLQTLPIVLLPDALWETSAVVVPASAGRLAEALVVLVHFLVGVLKFYIVTVVALVMLLPLQMPPGNVVRRSVLAPSDAFTTIAENDALRRRSLLVSKSITSFARYPERHPAGVDPAGDGSLDVDQLWVCWGCRCGFSRDSVAAAHSGSRYL